MLFSPPVGRGGPFIPQSPATAEPPLKDRAWSATWGSWGPLGTVWEQRRLGFRVPAFALGLDDLHQCNYYMWEP